MMDLVDVASEVLVPAMRAIFKDGEVTAVELRLSDDMNGSIDLSITVEGETFQYPVIQGAVPNMTAGDWSDNLRSLLADFVAESRFGWGQNRGV